MDKMMKSLIRCCRDQSSTIDKLKKILPDLLGEVTSDEEVLQGFILLLVEDTPVGVEGYSGEV